MSGRPWLRMIPRKSFFDTLYNSNSMSYARDGFLMSRSAELVNPHHHMVLSDTVWQDFDAETLAGMTDSKILSSFTSGFFGGFVFGMEGFLLNAGAWRILPVYFTSTLSHFYSYDLIRCVEDFFRLPTNPTSTRAMEELGSSSQRALRCGYTVIRCLPTSRRKYPRITRFPNELRRLWVRFR